MFNKLFKSAIVLIIPVAINETKKQLTDIWRKQTKPNQVTFAEDMQAYSEYTDMLKDASIKNSVKEEKTIINKSKNKPEYKHSTPSTQAELAKRFITEFNKEVPSTYQTSKKTNVRDLRQITKYQWDRINEEFSVGKEWNDNQNKPRLTHTMLAKGLNDELNLDKSVSAYRQYWTGEFPREMCL